MENLNTVEIKAFIPAKDYDLSKAFYADVGFTQASDTAGVAYFYHGNCSFLLQNFYDQTLAENFMMHLLVEDVQSWHQHITKAGIADKYKVEISAVTEQPWGMLDFVLYDPSGVLWRIAQNI
ncbi:VOC family protein [Methylophaga sp.]|uniref:VOC family protein n=1 Tax=Methylophaga sp. TaxID=2024840 RepID=UPI003A8DCED0